MKKPEHGLLSNKEKSTPIHWFEIHLSTKLSIDFTKLILTYINDAGNIKIPLRLYKLINI